MKKTKKKNKKEKLFTKRTGLLMMLVGAVMTLFNSFTMKDLNMNYLSTTINNQNQSATIFDNEMSWELLMAITLSSALLIAGVTVYFASKKSLEEK